jgi:hypothetical protein
MTGIQVIHNELRVMDPELAGRFEEEIREAAAAFGVTGECRIVVDRAGDDAIERVTVVLTRPDKVVEWRMALPVVAGDVRLAAESAFRGRKRTERRRASRADVDRRGKS